MNERIDLESRVRAVFAGLKQEPIEPSPYLRTRVLATLRERKERRRLRFWKRIALLSPVASVLAVVAAFWSAAPDFDAVTGRNMLVRVSMEEIPSDGIAYASVELPEGVRFTSARHPEIEERRSLEVAWESGARRSHLPVIIRSAEPGTKVIKVRFLDERRRVVAERSFRIRFKEPV